MGVYAPAEITPPFTPQGQPVRPTEGSTLVLDEVLVWADAHAPPIRTARARVGAAEATQIEASIALPANPQVGIGAGGRQVGGDVGVELEASVSQQLEVAGEPALRRTWAARQREVAEAEVNEARWLVHVQAHRLFATLLMSEERIAQAARFVEFAQSLRAIAAHKVEAGEAAPLVLLVADADLAQTSMALVSATQQRDQLRAQLSALIGWPAQRSLLSIQGELPPVRPSPEIEALMASMARNHPSLRVRELAVAAQRARHNLAERDAWPQPTLGLSYGREAPVLLGDRAAHIWMFSLTVPLPLWRTNQGERAMAKAQAEIADRERDEAITRLVGELRQAAIALDAAAERVALFQSGVLPQLEKNLALLQRAYELGEVDVTQVSQTREQLLDATSQAITARVTYYEAAATLEGLIGTELWQQEGSP